MPRIPLPTALWRALAIVATLWTAMGLPSARAQIYVGDNGLNTGAGGVAVFAHGVSGNVLADMTVVGASTGINNIRSVAANSTHVFVLCDPGIDGPYVVKFARPTAGNVAPATTTFLAPSASAAFGTYTFPVALAVDANNLYVLDAGVPGPGLNPGAVNVYALAGLVTTASSSPLAATRTIDGPAAGGPTPNNTGLAIPNGIAVDSTSIYVANTMGNNLLIFGLAASGNVAPTTTITGLAAPVAVAADATTVYALNGGTGTVTTYTLATLGAGGAVAAATTFGSSSITLGVFFLALDADTIYVGDQGDFLAATPVPSVLVFPKNASGADVSPTRTVGGTNAFAGLNSLFVVSAPGTAAPTVTASGGSTGFTAGGSAVVVDSGVTLTAVPAVLATATIQLTAGLQAAQDVLAFANNNATTFGNIAASYNATLGALQLVSVGATATKAQWQSALRAVTYNNTSGSPNTANRTVSTKIFDGAQTSNVATKTVAFASGPTAPAISSVTAPTNGTYTAGANLNFTVTFSQAVTVTGTPSFAVTVGSATRSATYVSGSGTTSLTFRYTVQQGDSAASGIAIASPIALNSGTIVGTSGGLSATLTFTAPTTTSVLVSTVPVLAASGGFTAFTAGDNVTSTPVVVDSAITISAAATLASGTVAITGSFQSGEDVLAFTNNGSTMGNVAGSYNATTGVLTLTSSGGTATQAQWQAALRAVTYTDSAITPNTANRTVSIAVTDGTQSSNTVTKTVTVTAVQQTPVVTASAGSSNFGGSAIAVDGAVAVSDRDNTTLASATVSFSTNFESSQDVLAFTNNGSSMGNVAGSYNATTGVLTLTSGGATATVAQWQAALRAVTYNNTSGTPSTASRTVVFTVSDGTNSSAAANKAVTVSLIPAISAVTAPANGTYAAGAHLNFSVTFNQAVTVTGTPSFAVTVGSSTRSATYVSGSGTTTLTFRYTVQLGDNATGGIAVASPIALNGGTIVGTGSVNATLTFTPPTTTLVLVSTVPVLTAGGGSPAFTSGDNVAGAAVVVDGGISISDPSSPTLDFALVQITGNFQSSEDVLSFTNDGATMGDISATFFPGGFLSGGLLMSSAGHATLAQWQAALRAVTYQATTATPNTLARTMSFTLNDGVQDSNTVTKTVTITTVAQTPTVTTSSGASSFSGSPVAVDNAVTVSDGDNSTLASGTVSITANFQAGEDVLAFANNGSSMGNIAGSYDATTGVVTLISAGATATVAEWQAALRAVTYNNIAGSPSPAERTVSFVVNDGARSNAAATKAVRPVFLTTTAAAGASATFSSANQAVVLSATVTSVGGIVNAGTFTFTLKNGSTTIGSPISSGTVASGTATASYSLPGGTAAGTYTIEAVYNPGGSFATSSGRSSLTINTTGTTVSVSAATASFGTATQTVPLSARVTSSAGTVNAGTVAFTIKNSTGSTIGSTVTSGVDSAGAATANYSLPGGTAAGTYAIQAAYSGSGSFAGSSSASQSLTIAPAATTVTTALRTATFNSAAQTVALSATVTTDGGSVNAGTVTFTLKSLTTVIGSPVTVNVNAGNATATYVLPAGTTNGLYFVQVDYNAGSSYASSSGLSLLTIGQASTVTTASDKYATRQIASTFVPSDGGNRTGLVFDRSGNLYFVSDKVLKKLTPAGVVQNVANIGVQTGRLAVDATGNVYFSQSINANRGIVRQVTSNGTLNTWAQVSAHTGAVAAYGSGNIYFVNYQATGLIFKAAGLNQESVFVNAGLGRIGALLSDASGNLYVGENGKVTKISSSGAASTYASGFEMEPVYLASDQFGTLYLGNHYQGIIKITTDGKIIPYISNRYMEGMGCDANGNVYVNTGTTIAKITSNLSLSATVTSAAGMVNAGTVTFTLLNGNNVVGNSVTSDPVKDGIATVGYPIPAGTTATSFTIKAVYNPGGPFLGSSDSSRSLALTTVQTKQIFLGNFSGPVGISSASARSLKSGFRLSIEQPTTNLGAVINPDGASGTLVGYLSQLNAGFAVEIAIAGDGSFSGQTTTLTSSAGRGQTLTFSGRILDGVLSGTVEELSLAFTAAVDPDAGSSNAIAGAYQASAPDAAAGATYSIIGTQGNVFVLALTPTGVAAGTGNLSSTGDYTVSTAQGISIAGTVNATSGATTATIALPGGATISVSGLSAAVPVVQQLSNLSILGSAGAGQNITAGFVVSGPKTVLVRGIGPGLSQFNVPGVQATPTLTLFDGTGQPVVTNSGWTSDSTLAAAFSQVGAFMLPATSRDTAAQASLPAGAYTLQVTGGTTGGRALAEIYDLDRGVSPFGGDVINLSSLGPVTGDSTLLVAGFVVGGNTPSRVLIRGLGPSLGQFGVTGALATPLIKLYDGTQTVLAQNQAWGTPVTVGSAQTPATASEVVAAAANAGAFPLATGSNDSSLVVNLAPGSYTVHLSGANNASGTALIEIYMIK